MICEGRELIQLKDTQRNQILKARSACDNALRGIWMASQIIWNNEVRTRVAGLGLFKCFAHLRTTLRKKKIKFPEKKTIDMTCQFRDLPVS